MDTGDCCKDIVTITAKQGSTFHWAGTINLPTGMWTALSSVFQSGSRKHVGDLTVTLGDPTLDVYPIELFADNVSTLAWNVPKLDCDILFIDSSTVPNVVPTQTFQILVGKQVTIYPVV